MKGGERQQIGRYGESEALSYLIEQGFALREKNFRFSKYGEIDLIVEKGELVLFVEVKARTNSRYGLAIESISSSKARNLQKTASFYLTKHQFSRETTFRFDLIALDNGTISWYKDIIR